MARQHPGAAERDRAGSHTVAGASARAGKRSPSRFDQSAQTKRRKPRRDRPTARQVRRLGARRGPGGDRENSHRRRSGENRRSHRGPTRGGKGPRDAPQYTPESDGKARHPTLRPPSFVVRPSLLRGRAHEVSWRAGLAVGRSAEYCGISLPSILARRGGGPSTLFAPSGGVLRIELLNRKNGTTTLELAGRVVGPWVDELSRSCERVLAIGSTLSVDLGQVSFVDRDGVRFLKRLKAQDVALVNCSPFVAEQLRSQG